MGCGCGNRFFENQMTAKRWLHREMSMTDKKVRWGIVSTANIGLKKVIPGILKSPHSEVVALASRDLGKAQAALDELGLTGARAHGSYEALFADPDVD
eukprot:gene15131-20051_t